MIEYTENETSYIQTYWADADTIGEAIDTVVSEAENNGIRHPIARQVDPYDINNLPAEGISRGSHEAVMLSDTVHSFPADDAMLSLPYGVIPSCIEGEFDSSEITEGYSVKSLDGGLSKLSVIASDRNLLDTYIGLLNMHSAYKVFMIELHSHYQNDKINEVFVNETIASFNGICDFFNYHNNDITRNGHVGAVSYLPQGKTNIKLTDHKMIEIVGYDSGIIAEYKQQLEALGYSNLDRFVSIDYRMHHWHYRPAASRCKLELAKHIQELGFTSWKRTAD